MKSKFIKSLTLALGVIITTSFSVQAVNDNSSNETIPSYMKPGTNIKYDENNKMVVLQDGANISVNQENVKEAEDTIANSLSEDEVNLAKRIKEYSAEHSGKPLPAISLPKPQPGMTVSYDGTGYPTYIKINGVPYIDPNMEAEINKLKSDVKPASDSGTYYANAGAFSWYTDIYGQADHVLGNYDCATDQVKDNCPVGTDVYAIDYDKMISCWLVKWDVGPLQSLTPPRVIDLHGEYVFNNIFGYNALRDGLILNAGYCHW